MPDRDRLIELFEAVEKDPSITCPHYKTDKTCDTCKYTINNFMCNHTERMVDYLLANGVICPPCKVGDTVHYIAGKKVYKSKCHAITQHKNGLQIHLYDYDGDNARYSTKDVFLTKEEAEAKLKECKK